MPQDPNRARNIAVIMAGGRGTRFWPRSRTLRPKQFLAMVGDRTLLNQTVDRLDPLFRPEDTYIVTTADLAEATRCLLPELPRENVLVEPEGRNTAPCIGLGAMHILKKYEDALMLVLPSDHLIKQKTLFRKTLQSALEVAEENSNLVTIGIMPDYPETGYGYIRFNEEISQGQAYKAVKFVEKPDLETAKMYVESGQYLWNSGMFIWKVSSILDKMARLMQETSQASDHIRQAFGTEQEESVLNDEFGKMPPMS